MSRMYNGGGHRGDRRVVRRPSPQRTTTRAIGRAGVVAIAIAVAASVIPRGLTRARIAAARRTTGSLAEGARRDRGGASGIAVSRTTMAVVARPPTTTTAARDDDGVVVRRDAAAILAAGRGGRRNSGPIGAE
jgi:hypothetical protein